MVPAIGPGDALPTPGRYADQIKATLGDGTTRRDDRVGCPYSSRGSRSTRQPVVTDRGPLRVDPDGANVRPQRRDYPVTYERYAVLGFD